MKLSAFLHLIFPSFTCCELIQFLSELTLNLFLNLRLILNLRKFNNLTFKKIELISLNLLCVLLQNYTKIYKKIIRVLLMGKSKYKRDWQKYDENVITRYTLMFPFYVFEH